MPEKLTHLTFGEQFNREVNYLPEKLTHLTFGNQFNTEVDFLPNSLTHLTFGWSFNQQVDNLPSSLTHLSFGNQFNQIIDNLPSSLTHLTFADDNPFDRPINNLPNSITILAIFLKTDNIIKLPSCLQQLIIFNTGPNPLNSKMIEIPHTVKKIYLNKRSNLQDFLKDVPGDCIISEFEYLEDIADILNLTFF